MPLLQKIILRFVHKLTAKHATESRAARLTQLDQRVMEINSKLAREIDFTRLAAAKREQELSQRYLREYLADRGK